MTSANTNGLDSMYMSLEHTYHKKHNVNSINNDIILAYRGQHVTGERTTDPTTLNMICDLKAAILLAKKMLTEQKFDVFYNTILYIDVTRYICASIQLTDALHKMMTENNFDASITREDGALHAVIHMQSPRETVINEKIYKFNQICVSVPEDINKHLDNTNVEPICDFLLRDTTSKTNECSDVFQYDTIDTFVEVIRVLLTKCFV